MSNAFDASNPIPRPAPVTRATSPVRASFLRLLRLSREATSDVEGATLASIFVVTISLRLDHEIECLLRLSNLSPQDDEERDDSDHVNRSDRGDQPRGSYELRISPSFSALLKTIV